MLNKKVEEAINAQINAEMWSAGAYRKNIFISK